MNPKNKAEIQKLFNLMNTVAQDIAQHMEQINQGQAMFIQLFVKAQNLFNEE